MMVLLQLKEEKHVQVFMCDLISLHVLVFIYYYNTGRFFFFLLKEQSVVLQKKQPQQIKLSVKLTLKAFYCVYMWRTLPPFFSFAQHSGTLFSSESSSLIH